MTLLLFAILLTLLFGSAWISGLLRNLALLAALGIGLFLAQLLGISASTTFYGGLILLLVVGGPATYWLAKVEGDHRNAIKRRREEIRAENYKREQGLIVKPTAPKTTSKGDT